MLALTGDVQADVPEGGDQALAVVDRAPDHRTLEVFAKRLRRPETTASQPPGAGSPLADGNPARSATSGPRSLKGRTWAGVLDVTVVAEDLLEQPVASDADGALSHLGHGGAPLALVWTVYIIHTARDERRNEGRLLTGTPWSQG